MASSGSNSVAFTDYDSIKFSWEITSQSTVNNTSTISWKLELVATDPGRISSTSPKLWSVTVNGTEYSGTNYIAIENNSTITLASGSTTIAHNVDGKKTFSYSFDQGIRINFGGVFIASCTGSGTGTLNTIARQSTLTASNGTLGTAQTLTIAKKATSFTHTITYKSGSASGTICTKSSSLSVSWTPPNELASQAPSANSVSVSLTITTYSGSTAIGSSSVSIVCAIPYTNTFVPVLMPSTSDAVGYLSTYGAYVQGQSKLKVDITTYGAYGAWITEVKSTFDGSTYNSESFTTEAINGTGTLKLSITVKDSRGRTSTSTANVSVLAYEYPKITALAAERCNADGTLNPAGSYMLAKFSAVVTSLNNKNTATYYVGYKKSTDADHTAVQLTALNGKYSVTNGTYVFPAEQTSSYTVILSVIDAFNQARTTTTGSSVKKVWSLLKKDGEIVGAAVGKIAEHEGVFDIGWKVKFSGGGDCVVEQGEKDGWTYRKWDSGVAECWKIVSLTTQARTAWGSLWKGDNFLPRQNYPFTFADKPVENVSLQSGFVSAMVIQADGAEGVNGEVASACYSVCRPASTASGTFYFSFYVHGKWK